MTDYRKIVSLSPDKYKFIPEWQALELYIEYLRAYATYATKNTNESLLTAKTFSEWLTTEV